MFSDVPREEINLALDAVAEQLLWESGVCEPPVDAFFVALRLGLVVTQDQSQAGRARIVRVASELGLAEQPTIVLGDDKRFERRQFAVAHELGEFAAVRVFDKLGLQPQHLPLTAREHVANQLAGRLLAPQRWLKKLGIANDWDLALLKDIFWTASHELLARRMLDMSCPIVMTLLDEGQMVWRRSNFRSGQIAMLDAEHDAWRESHHLSVTSQRELQADHAGQVSIRCWAIHELDWHREIMRTEVYDLS